ncbi:DUF4148 domain-containing protein [Paraburkholderia sediminicola]|jgi:hypothetical protein|uniref:DUF4148 domain-containing protein n=1 Tax=Paraburkholderia sediminicola TaxID=458836 RepID=UPI0038BD1EF5
MKFSPKIMTAITAFLPAMASLAQSNQPLTRAHVASELIQLEKAGFRPTDWFHYPQNIQTAQARIEEAANANHSPAQTPQDRPDGHSEGDRQ